MKKISVVLLVVTTFALQYCSSTKKTAKAQVPKLTYTANVQPLIAANCTPCHIPAKGGRMKAYDNYTAVSMGIDSLISRVNRNPGEKGFMPFKHPKLPDSTINVLV